MVLERIPFEPKEPPSNPAAEFYVPKFIYHDPDGPDSVNIKEEFFGSRKKLRIAVQGAGISCFQFLHHLQISGIPPGSIDVVVYEKNHDVGGVWLTTKCPGCRSDNAGVVYQFAWKRNVWSEYYPQQPETLEYLRRVAREEGFYEYMKFRHEIKKAEWRDEEAKWTLTVEDLQAGQQFEDKVDMFLELLGPVSEKKITIKGLDEFKGQVVHPAEWPQDLDLQGKRVAVVGYGSSGVQIIPSIIDKVDHLYILPPPAIELGSPKGGHFKYSSEQKQLLKDPDVHLAYAKAIDAAQYTRLPSYINGGELSEQGSAGVKAYMKSVLAPKPGLYESIEPTDFDLLCRRPTFGYGYLEALASSKCTVLTPPPTRFTSSGILDAAGKEHPVDVIIAATGYDQSHQPRYPKFVNGEDISSRWRSWSSPPSYMAMTMEGMPNYFQIGSAYGVLYGSFFPPSEAMAKYIVQVISKVQLERISHLRPKTRAVEHFTRHADSFLERTVLSGPCVAWYKNRSGKPATWPGMRSHFLKALEIPRYEDYEIVYDDEEDMFEYLGNGFLEGVDDGSEGADPGWFMGVPTKEVDMSVVGRLSGKYGIVQGQQAEPRL
ncbi:putative sterigmatocystin biosynthesis monooxygenase stcW [Pseudocercospora fuligena]|uniref:Putative sterigmatocystin biosynthesis monooxygenase stcW n=1 Tax=Pseudocercospora fuligena TaxID=685502 RepID=A0A8H6RCK6_9PEZI|nr:putative sterigmatocystin biosynthesis monooxygenase stcW [Pseudocercospora fuligena]